MHAKQSHHVGTRISTLNLGNMLKQQRACQKHKLQFPTEILKSQETFWPSFLVGKRVETFDELTLNLENTGKALPGNHGTNISMFYSSFPIVKQRYHWIFPLSNKPLHTFREEIQVLLDGPRGQLKKVSKLKQTQESPTINSACCLTSTHANSSLELSPSLA
jgi:hypothetical protein